MKYGDVLQYPDAEDPNHDWLFMYLGESDAYARYVRIVVIRFPAELGEYDDNAFLPGHVTLAGLLELEAIPT